MISTLLILISSISFLASHVVSDQEKKKAKSKSTQYPHSTSISQQSMDQKIDELVANGVAMVGKKQYLEATVVFDKALKLNPKSTNARYEKSIALIMANQPAEAKDILLSIVSEGLANEMCYQLLSTVLHDGYGWKKALEILDEGLVKFPNSGRLHNEYGVIYMGQEEYDKALEWWFKGVKAEPAYTANYAMISRIYAHKPTRLWSLVYGELYLVTEFSDAKAGNISHLLFGTYRKCINLKIDSIRSSGFCGYQELDTTKNSFKNTFCSLVDPLVAQMKASGDTTRNIARLVDLRIAMLSAWRKQTTVRDSVFFGWWNAVDKAGMFKPYSYFILSQGAQDEFKEYVKSNKVEFKQFLTWLAKNHPVFSKEHFFDKDAF